MEPLSDTNPNPALPEYLKERTFILRKFCIEQAIKLACEPTASVNDFIATAESIEKFMIKD